MCGTGMCDTGNIVHTMYLSMHMYELHILLMSGEHTVYRVCAHVYYMYYTCRYGMCVLQVHFSSNMSAVVHTVHYTFAW